MTFLPKAPVSIFVLCEDGKFYENLVYGDSPLRRAWFLCFDEREPAEIVIKESEYAGGNFGPKEILERRGFAKVLSGVFGGRRDSHTRFFGRDAQGQPVEGAPAISWFCLWKKGVRFPIPNKYDECSEIWPVMPSKEGVFFGVGA